MTVVLANKKMIKQGKEKGMVLYIASNSPCLVVICESEHDGVAKSKMMIKTFSCASKCGISII